MTARFELPSMWVWRLAALLAGSGLIGCVAGPQPPTSSQEDGIVLQVDVDAGEYLLEDDELVARLTGDSPPEPSVVSALACNNAADWLADRTLDNGIVVSANARLAWVAKLVRSGEVDFDLAANVELQYLSTGEVVLDAGLRRDGVTQAQLDAYLQRLSKPAEGVDDYAAYAVSKTMRTVRMVYVYVPDLPPMESDGFSVLHGFVATTTGIAPVSTTRDVCASLDQ